MHPYRKTNGSLMNTAAAPNASCQMLNDGCVRGGGDTVVTIIAIDTGRRYGCGGKYKQVVMVETVVTIDTMMAKEDKTTALGTVKAAEEVDWLSGLIPQITDILYFYFTSNNA